MDHTARRLALLRQTTAFEGALAAFNLLQHLEFDVKCIHVLYAGKKVGVVLRLPEREDFIIVTGDVETMLDQAERDVLWFKLSDRWNSKGNREAELWRMGVWQTHMTPVNLIGSVVGMVLEGIPIPNTIVSNLFGDLQKKNIASAFPVS